VEYFLPFQIQSFPFKFSYRDKILFIGSCFSEEIGNKMLQLKFDVLQNPNGILYDPLSISDSLLYFIQNKSFDETELFQMDGLWHSWKHHSLFSGINKKGVLKKMNDSQIRANQFLKEAKLLIITFGTAFNYELKSTHQKVANCHKAPASFFQKKLLSTSEIISETLNVLKALEIFNSKLKIIFTVSPVKHIKDGVAENTRSKARLIEAVHSVVEHKENTFYFPSYELVTDVLRDYRFYKSDLVHPNETSVNFVFEQFCNSLLDDEGKQIIVEMQKVINAVNHKPFFKESEAHKKFITAQLRNILNLEKKYPFVDLSREKIFFRE
jgi:hypothetical protein